MTFVKRSNAARDLAHIGHRHFKRQRQTRSDQIVEGQRRDDIAELRVDVRERLDPAGALVVGLSFVVPGHPRLPIDHLRLGVEDFEDERRRAQDPGDEHDLHGAVLEDERLRIRDKRDQRGIEALAFGPLAGRRAVRALKVARRNRGRLCLRGDPGREAHQRKKRSDRPVRPLEPAHDNLDKEPGLDWLSAGRSRIIRD